MRDDVFLDTCVLLYVLAKGDRRRARARQLMQDGGIVSVQVLNEFANTSRKKLQKDWDETRRSLQDVLACCPNPVPLTLPIHSKAVGVADRFGFSIYDGLIVAAAIEAGCSTLYTEDLQHGQVVDGVRIENPFLRPTAP